MIRERRQQDLDLPCEIAAALDVAPSSMSGTDPRAWLERDTVELAWVYDMAPVHVAPTTNVVGHMQLYRPTEASSTSALAVCAGRPAGALLAIGRFLIKPQAHDYGIARHLLKQSCCYIQRQGKTAVLDLNANSYLTAEFCETYGFVDLPCEDPAVAPMIYVG
ncbi:GNAT family N-acetyltransferase [Allobranchiibius sp. GilTou38]|uniref:GNAT family N-acetyltransferase n=1 Tax=Allobranchiibius sp. GilTou38 TaxID=2815210 RepID=UPI001AA0F7BB|nr:GNAT family N-acetyltransferase [Allobranchiibius sp. GilTou38]MBO1767271.1 GNAT family N-acetyltransferase [Allobranchiibius sp. GilTou38]